MTNESIGEARFPSFSFMFLFHEKRKGRLPICHPPRKQLYLWITYSLMIFLEKDLSCVTISMV